MCAVAICFGVSHHGKSEIPYFDLPKDKGSTYCQIKGINSSPAFSMSVLVIAISAFGEFFLNLDKTSSRLEQKEAIVRVTLLFQVESIEWLLIGS